MNEIMKRRHVCLATLLLSLLSGVPHANPVVRSIPNPEIDFAELDKLVPTELKEKNTPGAVIVIVSGDRVIYQKAFGVANFETNEEMKPEMLFRLGSTTKMFTAAALVKLSEQGKLKLNELLDREP
jgi:CubicO group peptidase (beta-lactamase class C family)